MGIKRSENHLFRLITPFFVGVCGLYCLLFPASPAEADNPKTGPRPGGFSQLDFDRPSTSATTSPPRPASDHETQVILEGTKSNPTPTKNAATPAATPAVKGVTTVKDAKVQEFPWVKPNDGQGHFLIPRLRGPQGDAGHETTISTEARWEKQNGACDVSRADLLCQKAKALKELLFRFSGDPDFYSRQCQQACEDTSNQAYLTAFRVKDLRGQSYEILQTGDKCRYQFAATGSRVPWLTLEGESGTCKCLPKGCAD